MGSLIRIVASTWLGLMIAIAAIAMPSVLYYFQEHLTESPSDLLRKILMTCFVVSYCTGACIILLSIWAHRLAAVIFCSLALIGIATSHFASNEARSARLDPAGMDAARFDWYHQLSTRSFAAAGIAVFLLAVFGGMPAAKRLQHEEQQDGKK